MHIESIDHLVLTVTDVQRTIHFYTSVLGMQVTTFASGRYALSFGAQKINLHPLENSITPKAQRPTPGSADLCFLTDLPIAEVERHLQKQSVIIENRVSSLRTECHH
ncbi:putative ring-cleaving dioxygenase [Magnetococcus marinus MC-1]|uniref:Putative ring-cleaving dioxygenase n=1 Tax=Magnetococcus marinus (strain ATCC BAA-1437 / JCM 17883 / MC-1) TaxID=156889 RepID=A0L8N0_MAGMM|nr:VOC family protein [Magnetococcus marinus]ABK44323.1 putative ring-cleaving dioxygenase [Magnetococcus marinus MC-1]